MAVKIDRRVKAETANPTLLKANIPKDLDDLLKVYVERDGCPDMQTFLSLHLVEYLHRRPWESGFVLKQNLPLAKEEGIIQRPLICVPVVYFDGRSISGVELKNRFTATWLEMKEQGFKTIKLNGKQANLSEASFTYSFFAYLIEWRLSKEKNPIYMPVTRYRLSDSLSSSFEESLDE